MDTDKPVDVVATCVLSASNNRCCDTSNCAYSLDNISRKHSKANVTMCNSHPAVLVRRCAAAMTTHCSALKAGRKPNERPTHTRVVRRDKINKVNQSNVGTRSTAPANWPITNMALHRLIGGRANSRHTRYERCLGANRGNHAVDVYMASLLAGSVDLSPLAVQSTVIKTQCRAKVRKPNNGEWNVGSVVWVVVVPSAARLVMLISDTVTWMLWQNKSGQAQQTGHKHAWSSLLNKGLWVRIPR
ncbi:hypothetical protein T265_12042 [Opisthorchis viverrini]|uniref:Uncharacterized protein n=1 Tax=Opisthorchis viverrini TaxID=6198 RepID=A0A074ZUZ9_OPIVI|nr:hypothetical protein T265_12042 [Opisthorchis viverrini]KER19034.1 hypothetical protein T265_12042 [Opisthorchis viverrini]